MPSQRQLPPWRPPSPSLLLSRQLPKPDAAHSLQEAEPEGSGLPPSGRGRPCPDEAPGLCRTPLPGALSPLDAQRLESEGLAEVGPAHEAKRLVALGGLLVIDWPVGTEDLSLTDLGGNPGL